jgi:uncharacterized protein (DUF927 family)
LSDNIDDNGIFYKLEIIHPVKGAISTWVSQEDLLTREGLKKLVFQGLLCSEPDYGRVEDYFTREIHRAEEANLSKDLISATTGWKREETIFIAGNKGYSTNGVQSVTLLDDTTAKSLEPKGNIEEWVKGTKWALSFPGTRINCYAVLSSVIAGYLKQPSIVLQNKGSTTTGKTLQSSIGLSLIGDPVKIMKSADTTKTGAERHAILTNGLCDVYDEVGLLKEPEGIVYMFSNGIGKQRGTNNPRGLEDTGKWFKCSS